MASTIAQVALAPPPEPAWARQERRNLRPLPSPRVACIAQLVTPILLPSDFSPHLVSPSLSANNTESQLTEITQFIFGQPLRRPQSGRLEGPRCRCSRSLCRAVGAPAETMLSGAMMLTIDDLSVS